MFNSSYEKAKHNYFHSTFHLNCHLKENYKVTVISKVGCNNCFIMDTKENELNVGLLEKGMDVQSIILKCKL